MYGKMHPEAREISQGQGFCTPRPERLPEGDDDDNENDDDDGGINDADNNENCDDDEGRKKEEALMTTMNG